MISFLSYGLKVHIVQRIPQSILTLRIVTRRTQTLIVSCSAGSREKLSVGEIRRGLLGPFHNFKRTASSGAHDWRSPILFLFNDSTCLGNEGWPSSAALYSSPPAISLPSARELLTACAPCT
jgi:hypothetical protein